MNYSRYEQETSIVWDEDGKVARIYTASPVSIRKLEKLCANYPQEYCRLFAETDGNDRITAAKYEVGCKYIRFGKPASEARKEQGRRIAALAAEKRNEAE